MGYSFKVLNKKYLIQLANLYVKPWTKEKKSSTCVND